MPVSGPQQEHERAAGGERARRAAATVDDAAAQDGAAAGAVTAAEEAAESVIERDERRAKMERLRAEGIDPYPHGSWLKDRTLIKDVIEAHDPSALEAGRDPDPRPP